MQRHSLLLYIHCLVIILRLLSKLESHLTAAIAIVIVAQIPKQLNEQQDFMHYYYCWLDCRTLPLLQSWSLHYSSGCCVEVYLPANLYSKINLNKVTLMILLTRLLESWLSRWRRLNRNLRHLLFKNRSHLNVYRILVVECLLLYSE
jgi:hypothetical protein